MTAPVITGGSITGVALSGNTLTNPVITGGSINNTTVGATTRSTGAFTTLTSNGATTFTAGTASTSTTTGTAVITGGLGVSGRINAANFDGIVGANTAAAGNFTTLGATGVATFSAGTNSAPAITTTGDTNTGIFFPAADTIAFTEGGVESMRIDSSGRLGIGTTAPEGKLVVSNSGAAGFEFFTNYPGGGLGTYIQSFSRSGSAYVDTAYDAATHAFRTSGTERMRITSAGDVGIGTSTVRAQEHIFGTGQSTAALTDAGARGGMLRVSDNSTAAGAGGAILFSNSQGDTANSLGFAAIKGLLGNGGSNTTGSLAFSMRTNAADTSLTERMRITAAGDVGIGTGSPTAPLTVASNATADALFILGRSADNIGVMRFKNNANNTEYSRIDARSDGLILNQVASGVMTFRTVDTERMRIDSSGNLLVGSTSASWNPSGGGAVQFKGFTSHAGISGAFQNNGFNIQWNGSAARLWVDTTDLGSITTVSDYRIKRNIETQTESGIDKVLKLRPVTYQMADFKDGLFKAGDDIKEGFIAHEVQEVIPSGADGVKDDENQIQSLRLDAILAVAVKAIQELKATIDAQAARIATLEAK
jgi:hypothetical protein